LTLPKNSNPIKRHYAQDLFLFMLRADNIDFYSRQCGFIPPDKSLIRIWMQYQRYNHLIEGLENHGRSCQNIPEWSEIEMAVNRMVSAIAECLLKNGPDVDDEITRLVFETHQKIDRILGYENSENASAVKERIRNALTQPIDEAKYEKGFGSFKNESGFSLRLIVVCSLGGVAIVLLLVFSIRRFRKR
jgi:multiple sugar transport system substrate-binding protein